MDFLSEINWGEQIVLLAVLFVSISFHEFSHGWAASQMGDDTAEREGRLTLNPLSHIDLYGTIILPIALLLFSGGNFVFGRKRAGVAEIVRGPDYRGRGVAVSVMLKYLPV